MRRITILFLLLVSSAATGMAATISTGKSSYSTTEAITVNFAGATYAADWVGIYLQSTTPSSTNGSIDWQYVNGTKTPGSVVANGSVTFPSGTIASAGSYKACLLQNDVWTVLAATNFTVTSPSTGGNPSGTEVIQWYKGQLHCHSTNSDGSVSPAQAVSLYKNAGYKFIALTDHDFFSNTAALSDNSIITIPAVEFTGNPDNGQHVGGLNLDYAPTNSFTSLQDKINKVLAAGADIAAINHPWWAGPTPAAAMQVTGNLFQEVIMSYWMETYPQYNGPVRGLDYNLKLDAAVWDAVLSQNRQVFGTGTDDTHDYAADFNKSWIAAQVGTHTMAEVMAALKSGDFYASSGVTITRIDQHNRKLTVVSSNGDSVIFIGKDGQILSKSAGASGTYTLATTGLYVRATVKKTNGQLAYTQAYFPDTYGKYACSIVSPAEGGSIHQGTSVSFGFSYGANKSSISSVKIYANDTLVAQAQGSPASIDWSNAPLGSYRIKAKTITSDGIYYWSNPVSITIVPAAPLIGSSSQVSSREGVHSRIIMRFGRQNVSFILPRSEQGQYGLRIYDVSGKEVLSRMGLRRGQTKIEAALKNGIYLAEFTQGHRRSMARFCISNR